jgi:hypothetical protein
MSTPAGALVKIMWSASPSGKVVFQVAENDMLRVSVELDPEDVDQMADHAKACAALARQAAAPRALSS